MKVVANFFLSLISGESSTISSSTTVSKSLIPRPVMTLFLQLERFEEPVNFSHCSPFKSLLSPMLGYKGKGPGMDEVSSKSRPRTVKLEADEEEED